MASKPIRVLIIDDSLFFREFMSRSLSADFSIEVVGVVSDAREAMTKVTELSPNIITVDIDIKNLQYKEFIRWLRQDYPQIQVVIISPLSGNVFEALKAGAVDFVAKPNVAMQMDNAGFIREVLSKIKTVYSGSMTGAGPRTHIPPAKPAIVSSKPPAPAAPNLHIPPPPAAPKPVQRQGPSPAPLTPLGGGAWRFASPTKKLIAIGASTGGTEAILSVVRDLPANTPGIVIVQHMPPVFTKMYAERLNKMCQMSAKEAQNGDRVQPGLIIVAEGDKQMRLASDARGYYVKVEPGEKVSGHCPSVDALFESVAAVAGSNAVGVILTGMGGDGAKNLLKMREAGAHTIGQDEATCVVYGMPMVAYNLGAVCEQLPLDAIPAAILRHLT